MEDRIKKITISTAGDYTLYYFDRIGGKRLYSYRSKHCLMMMATDNLTAAVLPFIRDASTVEFHNKKWTYRSFKEMISAQAQIFKRVSDQVSRDIFANLDL